MAKMMAKWYEGKASIGAEEKPTAGPYSK